ncbi:hypothetical protein BH23CHL5_BH23CHL5_25620 [soil metagenome]
MWCEHSHSRLQFPTVAMNSLQKSLVDRHFLSTVRCVTPQKLTNNRNDPEARPLDQSSLSIIETTGTRFFVRVPESEPLSSSDGLLTQSVPCNGGPVSVNVVFAQVGE